MNDFAYRADHAQLAALRRRFPDLAPSPRRTSDRLFSLEWDNAKLKIAPVERYRKREARGTHYATGYVTLDNGAVYETMSEMREVLSVNGNFSIAYDDGEESKT